MDLKAGYWQVPLREEDKEKTAFATKGGLYEFNMMPFELADQRPRDFPGCMVKALGQPELGMIYLTISSSSARTRSRISNTYGLFSRSCKAQV